MRILRCGCAPAFSTALRALVVFRLDCLLWSPSTVALLAAARGRFPRWSGAKSGRAAWPARRTHAAAIRLSSAIRANGMSRRRDSARSRDSCLFVRSRVRACVYVVSMHVCQLLMSLQTICISKFVLETRFSAIAAKTEVRYPPDFGLKKSSFCFYVMHLSLHLQTICSVTEVS